MSKDASETQIHHLAAVVHGRYLLRPPEATAQGLLVGFHGYGEDAAAHLAELEAIPGSEGWLLCSVQALHPFYTKSGAVVGCWMTSQDREQAIVDNVHWASSVVAAVRTDSGVQGPLVYAGFSQGVAMAYRAAASGAYPCHGVIALAGDVPPEVEAARLPRVLLGRGRGDTWYTEAKEAEDLRRLAAADVPVRVEVFDGGHAWCDAFRRAAGELLEAVAESAPQGDRGGGDRPG